MKQYKKTAPPAPARKPVPADKHEIDAAVQKLTDLITKDPGKAAKIFEAWLDSKGQVKKNVQKKSAA